MANRNGRELLGNCDEVGREVHSPMALNAPMESTQLNGDDHESNVNSSIIYPKVTWGKELRGMWAL